MIGDIIRTWLALRHAPLRTFQYTFIFSVFAIFSITAPAATSLHCLQDGCGTFGDGHFPHLVLGTVEHVATEAEKRDLFQWAQAQHYWQSLPKDEQHFVKLVQPVTIRFTDTQTMTLLMAQEEYDVIGFDHGDYVRYTYHPDSEHPPSYVEATTLPYWHLYGCIVVLCRVDDKPCMSRYQSGIFAMADGHPLDTQNYSPLDTGTWIDPYTYLPTHQIQ